MNKPFWEYEQNENGDLDIPVGSTFDYKEMTLKVICDNHTCGCDNCFFNPCTVNCKNILFACLDADRTDGKDVHFEEVSDDKKEKG